MNLFRLSRKWRAPNWPKLLEAIFLISLIMGGCSIQPPEADIPQPQPHPGEQFRDAIPKVEPRSKYGNPQSYEVRGRRYYVMSDARGYSERGIASWYGPGFHGKRTSSGESYDMYSMTAAHPTLPLPTYLYITNLENGRQAILRVNDRGPFEKNRLLDLSFAGARKLGVDKPGTALVEVQALDPENPESWPPGATILVAAAQAEQSPPETRAAAAIPPAENDPHPQLYLQVGAFSSWESAARLREKLIDAGLPQGAITTTQGEQQTLYRLRLGPFENVAAADNLFEPLERLGIHSPRVIIDD